MKIIFQKIIFIKPFLEIFGRSLWDPISRSIINITRRARQLQIGLIAGYWSCYATYRDSSRRPDEGEKVSSVTIQIRRHSK
jgi:hypothetical protein